MAITPKTIYLEPDEEITSVIDKIRKTEFADIVLVIPKGASISQSVVNLKLIKKKAEDLSKAISIVTGDRVARALAEKIGIPVAATVGSLGVASMSVAQSESEIDPLVPTDEVIFNKDPLLVEPDELTVKEGEDTEAEAAEKEEIIENIEAGDKPKSKSLVPKFPWLKVALFAGIPLLILLFAAYYYLPQAKSTISMKSTSQPVTLNFIGQPNATVDKAKEIIPTQVIDVTKEETKQFTATGQKDEGTKATGTVYVSSALNNIAWPAGTRIALGSDSSVIFKTDGAVNIVAPGSKSGVNVTAENPGPKYNIASGKTFAAVNDPDADITSTTAMTGGSTKTVTYISQGDFDTAKKNYTDTVTADATSDYNGKVSGLKIIDSTKAVSVVSSSSVPVVGQDGNSFSLTLKVEIKALGVNQTDLATLIKNDVTTSLGNTANVIDDGSKDLKISVDSADLAAGTISGTITTTAYVASKIDQNAVKTQLEGLNDSQAQNYLGGLDGVVSVKNEYLPPFIRAFPRIKEHIILSIEVSDSSKN